MVRETAFDGLKNGGGALAAGHSADFSGEHFFQRSARPLAGRSEHEGLTLFDPEQTQGAAAVVVGAAISRPCEAEQRRSEEHTSELQSLMRISDAVFCWKEK